MTSTESIEDVADLEAQRRSLTERIHKARKAAQQRRERIAEAYRGLGQQVVADLYGDTNEGQAEERIAVVAETLADDALLAVVRGQLGLPEQSPATADDEPREEDGDDDRHMFHMSREEHEEQSDESGEAGDQFPA